MAPWDKFAREKLTKIFTEKSSVIDIGGGLRILKSKGNRYDEKRAWLLPLVKKVDYKILDAVSDYHPDIVGDIHNLAFPDNSLEAVICLAVLEHVENPIKAASELFRVLKPGGFLYVYVPFLYYYHAEKGYYGDYWRFTPDSLRYIFKGFSSIEIQTVRGAIETWIYLSPLGRLDILNKTARFLDNVTGKLKSSQVSGYNVFLVK